MDFTKLNIITPLLKAIIDEGYETPTSIQGKAIPLILEGRDLLGCAQTGTDKTAAFAIPTLQLLLNSGEYGKKKIRALVVTPTRELAMQIYENFCAYGKYTNLTSCVIFGGVSQKPQENILRREVDILVATPGRLNNLIDQNIISLKDIEMFILDEADRMLDMGFIHDIRKLITHLPASRQTLLFSATMPKEIAQMANSLLKKRQKWRYHLFLLRSTPLSSAFITLTAKTKERY